MFSRRKVLSWSLDHSVIFLIIFQQDALHTLAIARTRTASTKVARITQHRLLSQEVNQWLTTAHQGQRQSFRANSELTRYPSRKWSR